MIKDLQQFEDDNLKDISTQEFQGTRAIKLKLKSIKSQKEEYTQDTTLVKPQKRAVMTEKTDVTKKKKKKSTDERETYQIKEKITNRQGIRKYDHYSQNDSQN